MKRLLFTALGIAGVLAFAGPGAGVQGPGGKRIWSVDEVVVRVADEDALPPVPLPLAAPGPATIPHASPGAIVGTTYYDYQHNGTISKMVAVEPLNGSGRPNVHMIWMNGLECTFASRQIYYNFRDQAGIFTWPFIGQQVGTYARSGYATMGVMPDGRAVVASHPSPNPGDAIRSAVAVDISRGAGIFSSVSVDPLSRPTSQPIWPHIAVDNLGYIHVASKPQVPGDSLFYSRSTDGGASFSSWALVQGIENVGYTMAASRSSGNVLQAWVYPSPRTPGSAFDQNVLVRRSTNNGASWFATQNITNYLATDSVRAYTDVSALVTDVPGKPTRHIAWTGYHSAGDGSFFNESAIYYWNEVYGIRRVGPSSGWYSMSGAPGAWRFPADRPSLAFEPNTEFLYCVWVVNSDADISAGGFPNGELYASYSTDWGQTWSEPRNLTNTPSPGCLADNCEDDDYPSLAADMDDSLEILYINDRDAGGISQNEGSCTLNPVLLLGAHTGLFTEIGVDIIPEDLPPIIIPSGGGTFRFTARAKNFADSPETFQGWMDAVVPNGDTVHVVPPRSITLQAGQEFSRTLRARVGRRLPAGDYKIIISVGSHPEYIDRDMLVITKAAGEAIAGVGEDLLTVEGWDDPGSALASRPDLPRAFALGAPQPNPFNPSTTVRYEVPTSVGTGLPVRVEIYTLRGERVRTLVDAVEAPGAYSVHWDGRSEAGEALASGVYLVRMTAGEFAATRKAVLLK